MSLDNLRKQIDETDASIARLVAERIKLAERIGREKDRQELPVTDAEREKQVLERIRRLAEAENINPKAMEEIYRKVIEASRKVQGVAVAFPGETGAYSEEAAFQYFGVSTLPIPCESLDEVFAAVERNEAPYGVVPCENSLEGSISRTYDLLLESSLKVRGETELMVTHCLIGAPGARVDRLKRVYSHPQALGQCRAYLERLNCELVPTYDTAGSVKFIKERGTKDEAAVASARAAEVHGMKILVREIEDNPNNFTRFFVLAKQDSPPTGNDKTSVVFAVKHKPGALYESLQTLADRKVNLTKIESRPTRRKPWEYNFYVDLAGHREDRLLKEALAALDESTLFVKVLGSYPKAK